MLWLEVLHASSGQQYSITDMRPSRVLYLLCWPDKHFMKWNCREMVVHSSSWDHRWLWRAEVYCRTSLGIFLVLSHWDLRDLLQLHNPTCLEKCIYSINYHGKKWKIFLMSSLWPTKVSWGRSIIISNLE